MGPAEELRYRREFGPACLTELLRLIRLETRGFPALRPAGGWHTDAYDEIAQELFRRRGKSLTRALLKLAHDDDTFSKYLRVSVHRWLIDLSRKSDGGYIHHRVEKLMPQRPEFTAVRLSVGALPGGHSPVDPLHRSRATWAIFFASHRACPRQSSAGTARHDGRR